MREPPKLTPPMPGDQVSTHLRQFCKDAADLAAWVAEAVARIESVEEGRAVPVRDGAKMLLQLESLADTPVVLRFDAERCEWRCEYGEYMHGAAYTPHEAVDALWNILARRKLEAV